MTLISPRIKLCAICYVPNPMMAVLSASFFGAQDLDGRSGHLDFMFMERCWWCGYCNPDLSASVSQKTRDFVKSDDYRWHTKRSDLPGLARNFQCYSVLLEEGKDRLGAGHASLVAAWACDDFQHYLGREYCRKRAIRLFNEALETGGDTSLPMPSLYLMLADTNRQLGQFAAASEALNNIIETSEIEARIREMEINLIAANDTKRYSIKDIPGDLPAESGEIRLR